MMRWHWGLLLVLFWVFLALMGPLFTSFSPYDYFPQAEYAPPTWSHFLGQGENGIDVFAHVIWGARNTLTVALCGVFLATLLGVLIGSASAYFGGYVDLFLTKLAQIFIIFPSFILFLSAAVFLGSSKTALILALVISSWGHYSRFVRGCVLKVREDLFVQAAKALGFSDLRILFTHIFRNIWAPLWIQMAYGLKSAILSESSLSYLGLGYEAGTPSWGALLSQGRDVFLMAPHLLWIPALVLFSLLLGFQLLGDGLSSLFRIQRID